MSTVKNKSAHHYRELKELYPLRRKIRSAFRDITILSFSLFSKFDKTQGWVRFPCYHHIFDDERKDFERQIKFLKNISEPISLDATVDMLEKKSRISGRYFCVTFDDGFKNCAVNAVPILIENSCTGAFFLPTDYIGCDIKKDREIVDRFFKVSSDVYPVPVEFMDWEDCRELLKAGMTIGSHTCSHVPIDTLNDEELRAELLNSKRKIEKELKIECNHFCCPWGRIGKHFTIEREPRIAREIGYKSFFTTERGPNCNGADPLFIRRDHLISEWGNYQLRYFFQSNNAQRHSCLL